MPENLDSINEGIFREGPDGGRAPAETTAQQTEAAQAPAEVKPKRSHHKKKPEAPQNDAGPSGGETAERKDAEDDARGLPLLEVILRITHELVCPKGNEQQDAFSGRTWRYRNIEDIQAALEPLLLRYGVILTSSTRPECVGEYNYITATVTLTNMRGESFSTTSSAREDTARDGSWASQISGSCDTYAKKMAMQSMFMICDAAADPDARQCTRRAGDAVQEQKDETEPVSGAQAAQPQAPKKPHLYSGHEKWMALVAEAGMWRGSRFDFQERVKKNYTIDEDNLAILLASLPDDVK